MRVIQNEMLFFAMTKTSRHKEKKSINQVGEENPRLAYKELEYLLEKMKLGSTTRKIRGRKEARLKKSSTALNTIKPVMRRPFFLSFESKRRFTGCSIVL